MNNDMKCPFCNEKLDNDDVLCSCINEYCEESFDMVGTEMIWQKVIDLKEELDRTGKALDESEHCCTEWEKQALDYKAENIALSGELERIRKALDLAKDTLYWYNDNYDSVVAQETINEITTLEQKEHFADASKMINKRM